MVQNIILYRFLGITKYPYILCLHMLYYGLKFVHKIKIVFDFTIKPYVRLDYDTCTREYIIT